MQGATESMVVFVELSSRLRTLDRAVQVPLHACGPHAIHKLLTGSRCVGLEHELCDFSLHYGDR